MDFEDMNASLGPQNEGEPLVDLEVQPETKPEEPTEPKPEEVERKRQSGVQRLKAKLQMEREARIRAEALLEAQKKPEPAPASATGKPDPNTFENQADYLEALTDWKVGERLKGAETKAQETRAKETRQAEEKSRQTMLNKAHEAHPDLAELLDDLDGIPVTPSMDSMFRESDLGGEILYHLASHPEECRRISGLSPTRQAAELGKIEAALAAKGKSETKPETQPSRAPAPIHPVQPSGATAPPASARYAKFEDF